MPVTRQRKWVPGTFEVWGCRGSRNFAPPHSRIGNRTSCYSLAGREELLVFDAGLGLAALGQAMSTEARFQGLARVHVFVTHAHMDHWEGFKDVEWFWRRSNGLQIRVYAPREALTALHAAFEPPSYVPLELLAQGTVARLRFTEVQPRRTYRLPSGSVRTFALNHYSGSGRRRRYLDTLAYRVSLAGGPDVAYVSDHEPTAHTRALEEEILRGTDLALYDAHFPDMASQTHGHGSQEHAAAVARSHPRTLILAGHHGPSFDDAQLLAAFRRFGRGAPNFILATEGRRHTWNGARFLRR